MESLWLIKGEPNFLFEPSRKSLLQLFLSDLKRKQTQNSNGTINSIISSCFDLIFENTDHGLCMPNLFMLQNGLLLLTCSLITTCQFFHLLLCEVNLLLQSVFGLNVIVLECQPTGRSLDFHTQKVFLINSTTSSDFSLAFRLRLLR
jgi:hypothetical protein